MSELERLTRRVADLEARLRRVEDVQEIQRLKARYAELVDARYTRQGPRGAEELTGLAREIALLFSEDAVWDGGATLGLCRGRDAIAARFREPTLRFSWHLFVKPRIHVSGDEAQGSWDVFAPCTASDGRAHWMTGVEHDEYRRVEGRWLHTRMRLDVVFMAPYEVGWVKPRPGD